MSENDNLKPEQVGASPASQTQKSGSEILQNIAVTAAKMSSTRQGHSHLPHGSKLYWVDHGWKSSMIGDDILIQTVTTLREFEEAMQASEVHTIFMPQDALISIQGIEKICQRNGVPKTIFKEVENDE